jgi:hypothetical protein
MSEKSTHPGLIWKRVGNEIVISTPPKCPDVVIDWYILREMMEKLNEH